MDNEKIWWFMLTLTISLIIGIMILSLFIFIFFEIGSLKEMGNRCENLGGVYDGVCYKENSEGDLERYGVKKVSGSWRLIKR